ncbi:MAG: CoA pyrophosphatase [Planctomycetota bacterium]
MIADEVLRSVLDPLPTVFVPREGLRLAAVLVPWVTIEGRDHLLLTRRRDDLPHHPGQVSFPGGAREGEEDPVSCALRESEEEIGLPPREVVLLGSLPPRISIARFWVHVVVGRIAPGLDLHPDPREVASLRAWPLDLLCDPSRWEHRVPHGDPHRPPSPHLDHEGETLWGLTARFVLDLVQRLHVHGS